jgi:hypothetical protein
MSPLEISFAQDLFRELLEGRPAAREPGAVSPRLMVGILVSSKTINGVENRYPARYPKPQALPALFLEATHYSTLNLAHYNTRTPENLLAECARVMDVAGAPLHGFQLNLCWPDPAAVYALRRRYPELHILLQVGAEALRCYYRNGKGGAAHYDAKGLAAKVREYEGIDGVLLDASDGQGRLLDPELMKSPVYELMNTDGLGIGVAGGLCAEAIPLLKGLAAVCPYLSIDAQGRLRSQDTDVLDLVEMEAYLRAAFTQFYGT